MAKTLSGLTGHHFEGAVDPDIKVNKKPEAINAVSMTK